MANKVQEIVLEKIITALKAGVVPWSCPWGVKNAFNAITKREYTGINYLLLNACGRGVSWLTAKQIIKLGGNFKGVKSELVTFYSIIKKKAKSVEDEATSFWLLKYYNLFPVSEITGLPEKYYEQETPIVNDFDPIEKADEVVQAYLEVTGVTLDHDGRVKAYYAPATDSIHLPLRQSFKSAPHYYATVFHELVHSTRKRLSIEDSYAGEELRAEIGSAMILASVGIDHSETIENCAGYCASWARALEGETGQLIIGASSKAQKGVDMILDPVLTEVEVV